MSRTMVFALACMVGGCRSGDKRAKPEPPIVVAPMNLVDGSGSATAVVLAIADAAPAVDAGGIRCGDERTVQPSALVALPLGLFPKDQRTPPKKGAWSAPARFDEERGPAAAPPGKNRIVIGDATLTQQCEALLPYDKPIRGPFDAMPSSDPTWTLTLYGGENNALVVVRDGASAPVAVRQLSIRGGTGTGAGMSELSLFPGGKNVAVWAYESADGVDAHSRWLLGFRDSELRILLEDSASNAMGSLETFEFTAASAAPSANPSILITYAIRESVLSEEDGGFRPQKALSRKRTVRWDPTKQTFR